MSFRLYAAATGGTALWTEQWTGSNGVQVSDGLFNVMLGSLTPIPQNVVAANSNLFLGITAGTDDEMSPRAQLGNVPFATQALSIPDGIVTGAKIADGAVTAIKLGTDVSIVPPDGSITAAKLANGAVTEEKLGFSIRLAQIRGGRAYADRNTTGWRLHQGSGVRDFTMHQTFSRPFEQAPVVVVSLAHTDSSSNATTDRLQVFPTNVTQAGFDVVFRTWDNTQVYGSAASWVAFTSP